MRPTEFFNESDHNEISPQQLLALALKDAIADAHLAVVQLHSALDALHEAANTSSFQELASRVVSLHSSFNPTQPAVELLNLSSKARHVALLAGTYSDLEAHLARLGQAQDRLDEAHYIVRQFSRFNHSGALFAAGLRLGHWSHQLNLARVTPVSSVVRVDLTATQRLATIANCPPALITALDRLFVADAIAAAAAAAR